MTNFLGYIFTILTVWSVVDHVAAAGFAVTTLACAVSLTVTHR